MRRTVQVIIASTRPGRAGEPLARWIAARAEQHGEFEVEIVDLAEVDLPMFAEPHHPRLGEYTLQTTRDFSAVIDRADGFILVFPEYNHSYNAALKNALDHLAREWAGKPAFLVSYGGVSAGTRAAVALEPVLLSLGMHVVGCAPVPFLSQFIDEQDGARLLRPNERIEHAIDGAVEALARFGAGQAAGTRS